MLVVLSIDMQVMYKWLAGLVSNSVHFTAVKTQPVALEKSMERSNFENFFVITDSSGTKGHDF